MEQLAIELILRAIDAALAALVRLPQRNLEVEAQINAAALMLASAGSPTEEQYAERTTRINAAAAERDRLIEAKKAREA